MFLYHSLSGIEKLSKAVDAGQLGFIPEFALFVNDDFQQLSHSHSQYFSVSEMSS
jgi:hypothetical protein